MISISIQIYHIRSNTSRNTQASSHHQPLLIESQATNSSNSTTNHQQLLPQHGQHWVLTTSHFNQQPQIHLPKCLLPTRPLLARLATATATTRAAHQRRRPTRLIRPTYPLGPTLRVRQNNSTPLAEPPPPEERWNRPLTCRVGTRASKTPGTDDCFFHKHDSLF
jgi:hypothetical protein